MPLPEDAARPARYGRRLLRSIRDFPKARREQRKLLLTAFPLVIAVRLALWTVPSRLVLRYALRWNERAEQNHSSESPPANLAAWAVRAASRRIPGASCLTQALAGQIFLGMHGYASQIRVGVAREEDGTFSAHAWLDVNGKVLIGDHGLERYTRLPEIAASVLQMPGGFR
jgi:hypothetical protein